MIRRRNTRRLGLVAIAVVCITGCYTLRHYEVAVSGLSDKQAPRRLSYYLIPGNQGTLPGDLQFVEFAQYTRKALSQKGFREAEPQEADLIIGLLYGISDPKTVQNLVSSPAFGQIPGYQAGPHIYVAPSVGITGYRYSTETETTYVRFLALIALDAVAYRGNQTLTPVWQTVVTSQGPTSDLRQVFPAMLAASEDFIGIDTGRVVNINISTVDPRISDLTR